MEEADKLVFSPALYYYVLSISEHFILQNAPHGTISSLEGHKRSGSLFTFCNNFIRCLPKVYKSCPLGIAGTATVYNFVGKSRWYIRRNGIHMRIQKTICGLPAVKKRFLCRQMCFVFCSIPSGYIFGYEMRQRVFTSVVDSILRISEKVQHINIFVTKPELRNELILNFL